MNTQFRRRWFWRIATVVFALGLVRVSLAQTAPSFITQPGNVSVGDGGFFTISVQVATSNFAEVSWRVNLPSRSLNSFGRATSQVNNLITASVSFGPVSVADAGSFQVVATNSFGSTLSQTRTLTVTPSAPSIETQPASQTVAVGSSVSFVVSASGTAPLAYQWRKNGSPVAGATRATLAFASIQLADAAIYTVAVSNSVGSTTSASAVLTVTAIVPPSIAQQPGSQTVNVGANHTFQIVALGTAPLAFQWRRDGVPILGATATSLPLTNIQPAVAGSYSVVVSNGGGTITSDAAMLVVSQPIPSRLVNLAVRANAGIGADVLIVGFVVGGAGTEGNKRLLVRGVGPTLGLFGITGALADPNLQIFAGSTLVAENDNWTGDVQIRDVSREVGAFELGNSASKDAALVFNRSSGAYSAQISGIAATTGIALAEIYDATPFGAFVATTPRLINVSVRARVGTGADVLIAGFVVSGPSPKTVLIRAIGPTLSVFGVSGALVDPRLDLYSGGATSPISFNDNWATGGASQIMNTSAAVGAFGLSLESRDAVLLVTLPPGAYTAQASGVSNTTGVALVEIYDVP